MQLIRVAANGTYGVLVHADTAFAVTLERPWRENRRNESCIPAGRYDCSRCALLPDWQWRPSSGACVFDPSRFEPRA